MAQGFFLHRDSRAHSFRPCPSRPADTCRRRQHSSRQSPLWTGGYNAYGELQNRIKGNSLSATRTDESNQRAMGSLHNHIDYDQKTALPICMDLEMVCLNIAARAWRQVVRCDFSLFAFLPICFNVLYCRCRRHLSIPPVFGF